MPVYNRQDLVLESIESVIKDQSSDYELIVVDDLSTDNTLEKLSTIKDPKLKIFQSPQRKNGNLARNTGAKFSNGKYLSFLDSDDIFLENRLSSLRKLIKDQPSEDVFLESFIVSNNGNLDPISYPNCSPEPSSLAKILALHAIPITCSTITIKRATFDKLGGFDENFSRHQDRDFLLDLLGKGYRISLSDSKSLIKVQNSTSFSRSPDNYFLPLDQLISKHKKVFNTVPEEFIGYLVSRGFIQLLKKYGLKSVKKTIKQVKMLHSFQFSIFYALINYSKGRRIRKEESARFILDCNKNL